MQGTRCPHETGPLPGEPCLLSLEGASLVTQCLAGKSWFGGLVVTMFGSPCIHLRSY